MNISGNTIFIPGSTSGIGLALALALEASGNTVIVGGRRADLLDKIAAGHPGIDTVVIDTADAASIRSAAQPDAKEIQVERVKFLRYGEARGDYDQVVAVLNSTDPHGK
jgi:NADP-dependent 3-hydroxy acid dehydrogenase YdfG